MDPIHLTILFQADSQIPNISATSTSPNFAAPAHFARGSGRETTYTEEVVQLLTEKIEKRATWEHQNLLFSLQNRIEQRQEQPQQIINLEFPYENGLEFLQIRGLTKLNSINQRKTPDALPDSQLSLNDSFIISKANIYQAKIKKVQCNCKRSQCLKMYCQCFRAGEVCEGCDCCDCRNTDENVSERITAILKVKEKQPGAFIDSLSYRGCRCTRSHCQNGYCQCFSNGVMCGKYCRCKDCNNCSAYMKGKQKKGGRSKKLKKRQ